MYRECVMKGGINKQFGAFSHIIQKLEYRNKQRHSGQRTGNGELMDRKRHPSLSGDIVVSLDNDIWRILGVVCYRP